MNNLTKVERLRIIEEQLKALRNEPKSEDLRSAIRDVRELTSDLWYAQDWNASDIDC